MHDLQHLKVLVAIHDALAVLFCLALTVATIGLLAYWRHRSNDFTDADAFYLVPIIEACAVFTVALNAYIKYFGIPTSLTFGYQIGKILPATCEASMPIEGELGWPCSMKRFREWVERATKADGTGLHLHELETAWTDGFLYLMLLSAIAVALIALAQYAKRCERRGPAKKHG